MLNTRMNNNDACRPGVLIIAALLAALLFSAPAALFAQDNDENDNGAGMTLRVTPDGEIVDPDREFAWSITRYTGSVEDVTEQISDELKTGNYLPVGLEADPDISILLVANDDIEFSNWLIYEFDDADRLNDEFTAFLADGWVPMDIARTRNGITALFIESEIEINGWTLETSLASDSDIEETVEDMISRGYSVWGQAFDGEGMWHLGVREVGLAEPREYRHITFPDIPENVQITLNAAVAELWVPWGMSLLENRIHVTLIR